MPAGHTTTVHFMNGQVFSGFVATCVRYNECGSNQYDGPPLATKETAQDWARVWHIAISYGLPNDEAASVASRAVAYSARTQ